MWKRKKGTQIAHYFDPQYQVSATSLLALCGAVHKNVDLIEVKGAWPTKHKYCANLRAKAESDAQA